MVTLQFFLGPHICYFRNEKKVSLLYFHKKVSKTGQLFVFHMQPLEDLYFL